MMKLYDQQHIQNFYDQYADLETQRWEKGEIDKVKLFVHRHYLEKYIESNDTILELGAGTGVFTQQLAQYSNQVTVTDLSPIQLKINQERAKKLGYHQQVKAFKIVDICDLSEFRDNSFDKIVCYGGPLSYVFNQKHIALQEMYRVLKPNGLLFLGVMNLWGTLHEYMHKIVMVISPEENEKVISTGNLHPSSFAPSEHHCHMFTADELKNDIDSVGFQLEVLSASNALSALRSNEELKALQENEANWSYFLDLELRASRSSGMVESGTHMIAVARKL